MEIFISQTLICHISINTTWIHSSKLHHKAQHIDYRKLEQQLVEHLLMVCNLSIVKN